MLDEILEFNKQFVANKGYEKYITNKYPDKKIAILSCMDTRLTELLPAALGIKNGDVKMIKNAGGVISHPFGSVIRSLMVAIYELGVKEVMVIAHSDCGACHMNSGEMIEHMKARGIKQETIDMIHYCGVDFVNQHSFMIAWPLIVYGRNDWIFGLFFYSLSAYNRACWTYYLGTFYL